jgi:hypothetical protein
VQGHGNVAKQTAEWSDEGDATLADGEVNPVVEQGGDKVANGRDDENRRDSGVADIVVRFNLEDVSTILLKEISSRGQTHVGDESASAGIVHAEREEGQMNRGISVDVGPGAVPIFLLVLLDRLARRAQQCCRLSHSLADAPTPGGDISIRERTVRCSRVLGRHLTCIGYQALML